MNTNNLKSIKHIQENDIGFFEPLVGFELSPTSVFIRTFLKKGPNATYGTLELTLTTECVPNGVAQPMIFSNV